MPFTARLLQKFTGAQLAMVWQVDEARHLRWTLMKQDQLPTNPRYFNMIEGGRKRVPDTFIDKDRDSCTKRSRTIV